MMSQQQSRYSEARREEALREKEESLARQQGQDRWSLEALVRERVLHDLGEPPGLQRVQVRQLWDRYYRVNVFVGPDAVSSKVAHSFFLEADGNGTILDSMPAIAK